MAKLIFEGGRAFIKSGRKTIAKIYNCPEYYAAKGVTVWTDPVFPYTLELPRMGLSAKCRDLGDVERLFKIRYPADLWPNEFNIKL